MPNEIVTETIREKIRELEFTKTHNEESIKRHEKRLIEILKENIDNISKLKAALEKLQG